MKHVLITGNVASLASTLCQRLCRAFQVTVAASEIPETALGKGIEAMPLSRKQTLAEVFAAQPYDAVVFLGTRSEQQRYLSGEADMLSSVLALASSHRARRVLYASGGELCFPESADGDRGLKLKVMEQLCGAYRQKGLNVTVLRLPLIFGPGESDTLIGRMLMEAAGGGMAEAPFPAEAQADFLSAAEAAQLIEALLKAQQPPDSLYTACGGETLKGSDLKALFELLGCDVSLGAWVPGYPPMDGERLAQEFGFVPRGKLSAELSSLYASFKGLQEKRQSGFSRAWAFLGRHPGIVKGASLLLGYGAMEWLAGLQGEGQLPVLDVRLIYVVLIGAAHGLQTGLIAMLLACFSLARGYGSQGMTLMDLLKDWRPWVPVAAMLLSGGAAGLARDRGGRDAANAREAAHTLENRCSYLQELYKQSLLSKATPPPPAGEGIEKQLAGLREGQEKLMQEWLSVMERSRASAAVEEVEINVSDPPEQVQPAIEPEEEAEKDDPADFPQDADLDPITEPDPLPEPYPQAEEPAYGALPDYGSFYEEPKGERARARKSARGGKAEGKGRFGALPHGSPLASMSPSERRQMLEAMQERAAARRKSAR